MSGREIEVMRRWQRAAGRGRLPSLARAYSTWGEHAAGWMLLGVAGAALDPSRRRSWLSVSAAAFVGHAGAVVLKRVVRRRRPQGVDVLVTTPSDLSFPSAHAASTTAAAVALVPLVGRAPAALLAVSMGCARVLLGVHFPTDVLAGTGLGAAAGGGVLRLARARARRPGSMP